MIREDDLCAAVGTVECRYCDNLNHWIPTTVVAATVECQYCHFCPMYVYPHDWHEHREHNGGDAPTVLCLECPECGGPIPAGSEIAPCRLCDECKRFIPIRDWESHVREGCYRKDNPFA